MSGGDVLKARRLNPPSNLAWVVPIRPTQNGDVEITLPSRECTDTNAVCVNANKLAAAVSATVRGRSLSASFSRVPPEHDGSSTFTLAFSLSHEPDPMSFETVRDSAFDVTGGAIEYVRRVRTGQNREWELRVRPSSLDDVTLTLRETTACDSPPGICAGGQMLPGGLTVTVPGPATLSVADATVAEAAGATLDFVVTLSRGRDSETTVEYATSNGTATAGSDYTETSGTLTFTALQTWKTVSVPVLDDAHDDGGETMTLTLSNPSPSSHVRIADGTATGTITNTDPMPRAWMVRFGRTVGTEVVDALNARLDGAQSPHVTVGGIRLSGQTPEEEPEAETDDPFALPAWATEQREGEAMELTGEQLLLGSAFHLSNGDGGPVAGPALTAWGRVTTGGFSAEEDDVTMDGDVTTGMVGFDAEWERLLAGVMLSQSEGEGSYALDASKGDDSGTVESSMTGVYPYARLELNARVSAWALAGDRLRRAHAPPEAGKRERCPPTSRCAWARSG